MNAGIFFMERLLSMKSISKKIEFFRTTNYPPADVNVARILSLVRVVNSFIMAFYTA